MGRLQKFYFQAVDNDNHRISGSIFAEDESVAKTKLKKQGLALFSIELFDDSKSKTKEGLNLFEFEGTNPDGKHVRGKIEAINAYEAYKKLQKDYEFQVTSIVDAGLDFEEKSRLIEAGISDEFKKLYKEESFTFKKKKSKKKKIEIVEVSEKDKKELAFYSHEIGVMAKEIRELLEKSEKYLKREEKRKILQRLGLIERLRQSNAVDHLRNLTNKLIQQLSDDKIFIEEHISSYEEQKNLDNTRNEFKNYSNLKKKSLASKALEMNIAFDIDARKIALDIYKIRPITQLGFIAYWSVSSIFCLMTILWIKNGVQIVFNQENVTKSWYVFKSLLLWLITAISLVNMMLFAPMVFSKKTFTLKERLIYFGIGLILNIIVIVLLPSFF